MGDIFDSVAGDSTKAAPNTAPSSGASPSQYSPGRPTGDVFDHVAAGAYDRQPSTDNVQPGFASTALGDVGSFVKGAFELPGKSLAYGIAGQPHDDVARSLEQQQETHKKQVYHQFANDFHAGNYRKAFSGLLDLFDPKYGDPNDPLNQVLSAQWKSSADAKNRMLDAAKKGDTLGVIQHAAGIVPIASQVDAAMENYRREPTRENLAHILTSALPAFIPSAMRATGKVVPAGMSRFSRGGEGAEIEAATPAASQVQKAVARAPISEGTPAETALTPAEQAQKLQTEVQPALRKGIQDVARKAAEDSGIKPAKAPARLRDSYHVQGNAMKASAQADFRVLDEASGGRWQRFQDQIDNIQRKMDEVSGIDDDAYADLETKRNSIQTDQAQMIEDLKESGKVDPALADRANAMYRKAYANYDVGNAVRGATKRASVGGEPADVVDPSGLSQRLQKLDDQPIGGGQSRLRQALGDENAEALLGHADTAQVATQAIKDYVPKTATGRQALTELLQNNTGVGRSSTWKQAIGLNPKIDYLGAYSDFNKMKPAEQAARFGAEVPQAKTFIQSQARWQVGKMIVGGLTLEEIARRTGIASAVLHALIGS